MLAVDLGPADHAVVLVKIVANLGQWVLVLQSSLQFEPKRLDALVRNHDSL